MSSEIKAYLLETYVKQQVTLFAREAALGVEWLMKQNTETHSVIFVMDSRKRESTAS